MRPVLFSLFFFLSLVPVSSGQTPTAMKEQANSQVLTASRLMQQGFGLIQGDVTAQERQMAISLLIEAGQLFEKATLTYEQLAPAHASPQDVENSRKAMQTCIAAIQRLKGTL